MKLWTSTKDSQVQSVHHQYWCSTVLEHQVCLWKDEFSIRLILRYWIVTSSLDHASIIVETASFCLTIEVMIKLLLNIYKIKKFKDQKYRLPKLLFNLNLPACFFQSWVWHNQVGLTFPNLPPEESMLWPLRFCGCFIYMNCILNLMLIC